MMEKVLNGIRVFESKTFPAQKRIFAKLAKGQQPQALLITCSDSRIVPTLITNTAPGDLFVVRNPGNIVPPSGTPANGAAAAIAYAIGTLGVQEVIICGHTCCAAVQALADGNSAALPPEVEAWIRHALPARAEAARRVGPAEESLRRITEENTLLQVRNARTYRAVAEAEAAGRLRLHAWLYDIERGRILMHDVETGEFRPSEQKRVRASRARASGGSVEVF